MAYIAGKPCHFDRDYKIGEVIPPEVIEPKMVRKLIEMGKIIQVSLPSEEQKEPDFLPEEDSPESASDCPEPSEDKADETPQNKTASGKAKRKS